MKSAWFGSSLAIPLKIAAEPSCASNWVDGLLAFNAAEFCQLGGRGGKWRLGTVFSGLSSQETIGGSSGVEYSLTGCKSPVGNRLL